MSLFKIRMSYFFGNESAVQLDKLLRYKHFPEILFFSITKELVRAKELTCKNIATIQQHSEMVTTASFSPDGKHLVTTSDDGSAKVWGLVDGEWQEKATIQYSNRVNNASFSPDGTRLLTTSDDGTAKVWVLVDGEWQEEATIEHTDRVVNASFSPDGTRLLTTSKDKTVKIWVLKSKDYFCENSSSIYHAVRFDIEEI